MWNQHLKKIAFFIMQSYLFFACAEEANFSTGNSRVPSVEGITSSGNAQSPGDATGVSQGQASLPSDAASSPDEPKEIKMDFRAALLRDSEFKLTGSGKKFEHELLLNNAYEKQNLTFKQIALPAMAKVFQQGSPGTAYSQTFQQEKMGILDLQLIVDSSGSMSQEQLNLSTKLEAILDYVKDSDWQINIVTTDPKDGCSRALLRKGEPNLAARFAAAVNVGTSGTGNEQGVRMAVEGLSCATTPWVRASSTIAVLIVSDEDNCSSNGSGCVAPYNNVNYLINHLANTMKRKVGEDARVYGIFWHPNESCSTGAFRATQYASLVSQTKGAYGSICDKDYTQTLRKISQDVSTILKSQFQLTGIPDASGLTVKINGIAQTSGFSLQSNVLTFSNLPTAGASIEIAYKVGSSPMSSRFPLGEAPATDSLVVYVNGMVLPKPNYSIDVKTNELVFNSMPAANASIKVEFKKSLPFLKEFLIGSDVRGSTLKVTVNGKEVKGFSLNALGMLVFTDPPAENADIKVEAERSKGPILSYNLNFNIDQPLNLTIKDKDTREDVIVSISRGVVTVPSASFREGRRLVVSYVSELADILSVPLPPETITGSLTIASTGEPCLVGEGGVIKGSMLELNCNLFDGEYLSIKYSYLSAILKTFSLAGVAKPEEGEWEVLIDGVKTKGFDRVGSTITLRQLPSQESTITLVYRNSAR